MNTSRVSRHTLLAIGVSSILLAACTTSTTKPEGADALRTRLTRLQSNSELASRAPLAWKDADLAVSNAELPQSDRVVAAHLVYMADRKINIAAAQAENLLAVDERKTLSEQREALRLQARAQEADVANSRLTASGKGESSPIVDDATSKGRQQHRRVEVIIADVPVARDEHRAGQKFRVEKQPVESVTGGDR